MSEKFNQAKYIEEFQKEHYDVFRTKLKKAEFKEIEDYIKERNQIEKYSRADFLREAIKLMKLNDNQQEEKTKL